MLLFPLIKLAFAMSKAEYMAAQVTENKHRFSAQPKTRHLYCVL